MPVVRRPAAGILLAVAVALAATSCSGGSGKAAATVRTSTTRRATTTTPADPYAIPAKITPEYLDRVFKALAHIEGDARRETLTAGAVTPTVVKKIDSIFADDLASNIVNQFSEATIAGHEGVKSNPGDAVTTAQRIISASPKCIFVEVVEDYRSIATDEPQPFRSWIALRSRSSSSSPTLNPTPWQIAFDGANADHSEPTNPCVA